MLCARNLGTQFLELRIQVGQVFQLGGANKGKVGRVEDHHRPFAFHGLVGHFDEFTILKGLYFKRFNFGINKRHFLLPLCCG
jgi:hypothetical protein